MGVIDEKRLVEIKERQRKERFDKIQPLSEPQLGKALLLLLAAMFCAFIAFMLKANSENWYIEFSSEEAGESFFHLWVIATVGFSIGTIWSVIKSVKVYRFSNTHFEEYRQQIFKKQEAILAKKEQEKIERNQNNFNEGSGSSKASNNLSEEDIIAAAIAHHHYFDHHHE